MTRDENKNDNTKDIHPSILKMIAQAAASAQNNKNEELPVTFKHFVNCKNNRMA
jgi:hypothetical protein